MDRINDIKENLKHAERLRQELFNDMFLAKKQNINLEKIVYNSGAILSIIRECYDYCAQDIFENFILPKTNNPKLISQYNEGKLRPYFPFYEKELLTPGNIFHELLNFHVALHSYLLDLSRKIFNNSEIPGTLFNYEKIIELKEMVNLKKHNRLLVIKAEDDQEVLIEKPEVTVIIPIKKQKGWNPIPINSVSDTYLVKEFLFEFNGEEVGEFCLFAVKSGEIIFDEIYSKFFNMPLKLNK